MTAISAPLPELDWNELSIISVDTGNASAKITELVIHLSQDVPVAAVSAPLVAPLFTYGAPGNGEAPGLTRG